VKSGLDLQQLISVLSSTAAGNKVMEEVYPNSLYVNDFSLGFSLNLAHKDVGHALKLASEKTVPCPIAAITHQWQNMAKSRGMGNKDHSSLATVIEHLADVRLRT
jgi:4-hydroxybutyrate dehydrogenase/sulfolactaldehyde 3-reductase